MAESSRKRTHEGQRTTSEASEESGRFVVAAIENRGKEIGVAAFDKQLLKLCLSQYIETSRTYTVTLTTLQRYPPIELVLVDEKTKSRAGGLTLATRSAFDQVLLPRSCFDDAAAEIRIERLAVDGRDSLQRNRGRFYLAIGAAGALLTYLQDSQSLVIRSSSLALEFFSPDKHMQMDLASIECLGIARPNKVPDKLSSPSLFKLMNHTKTAPGSKLLKASLLQPLTHVPTLRCRYDAVQELVEDEGMRVDISEALSVIPKDLDKICAIFSLGQRDQSAAIESTLIAKMIDAAITMKEVLEALQNVQRVLQAAKSDLLKGIRECVGHEVFGKLLEELLAVLDDQVHRQRSSALKKIEQCYAVKSGYDGFLDMARTNFCKITERIHDLADSLQQKHNLQNIKASHLALTPWPSSVQVSFNTTRGFSFVAMMASPSTPIPEGWLAIESKGTKGVHFVTHELIALNSRLRDATHDCMLLTQQAMESIIDKIVEDSIPIRKMIDGIALLDLIWSFANLAASTNYTRPSITSANVLVISEGRHPILEAAQGVEFVSNDTFLSSFSSCHIVTGPNMSGKSTYLKQVALLLVMAQVGSFVPATEFLFKPRDKLFSRTGFSDSIETNSSNFMIEMQEMAYILDSATKDSLVIVDELGRSTSTIDGESIAWAITEKLIDIASFSIVATHFHDLPRITQVVVEERTLRFTWRIKEISASELAEFVLSRYGIRLAKLCDFPSDILERAESVADSLQEQQRLLCPSSQQHQLYSIARKLLCTSLAQIHLTDDQVRTELCKLSDYIQSVPGLEDHLDHPT